MESHLWGGFAGSWWCQRVLLIPILQCDVSVFDFEIFLFGFYAQKSARLEGSDKYFQLEHSCKNMAKLLFS